MIIIRKIKNLRSTLALSGEKQCRHLQKRKRGQLHYEQTNYLKIAAKCRLIFLLSLKTKSLCQRKSATFDPQ